MSYPELPSLDFPTLEREVREFWQAHRIFERSVEQRPVDNAFVFYEGPPSANGAPGIHHVMARTIKDLVCRFRSMQGYRVERRGGWDTHGLPVELQVEKELGITKQDIGKTISVADYNARCREAVLRYKAQWDELTRQMAYWVDLEQPYITFENPYIESVWDRLKRLYDQGLLYQGYTIQPYSPAAGTGLSSHELNQPGCYRQVKDLSVTAQFKITAKPEGQPLAPDEYVLAWTTTPWTLPANAALAVNPKIQYACVETRNRYTQQPCRVWLAKDLIPAYFDLTEEAFPAETANPSQPLQVGQLLELCPGRELLGWRYQPLFDFDFLQAYHQADRNWRIIPGDFVTTEDGTGVVHLAPTFGADDFRAAQQAGAPAITVPRPGGEAPGQGAPIVDPAGRYQPEMRPYANRWVKDFKNDPDYTDLDVDLVKHLKQAGLAFRSEKYVHNYPHCWRTDKPVLYYPLNSWFVATTQRKEELVAKNQEINWKPASTGTGRFGNWLENLVDWNLSRSRYWGIPLPIWHNGGVKGQDRRERLVGERQTLLDQAYEYVDYAGDWGNELTRKAGAELVQQFRALQPADRLEFLDTLVERGYRQLRGEAVQGPALVKAGDRYNLDTLDLHRPLVDYLVFAEQGELYCREPDLIDVWFDSGSMPYAQWRYPFENQQAFQRNFPADFIAEGVDQTRGWFFTLHAIAVLTEGSVAFRNVISNGLVLDKDGNKMSKRLGNAIDPFETLAHYGADPTRWYLVENTPPWENLRFNLEGVEEARRKYFGTLYNTYNFFALYAKVDGYSRTAQAPIPVAERTDLDKWVLARLHRLVTDCTQALANYEPTPAARALQHFVTEELSNWYVRLSRRRFWKGEPGPDKQAAYDTLWEVLSTVCLLTAPVAPYLAERLYKCLTDRPGNEADNSVHLADWPSPPTEWEWPELEQSINLARRAARLGHSIRKKHKLRARLPLSRLIIPVLDEQTAERVRHIGPLLQAELNVKEVEPLADQGALFTKKLKPDFKALGPRLGPRMKALAPAVQALEQADIRQLEEQGHLEIALAGEPFVLQREEVEILTQDVPGWAVASEEGLTVALDLQVTPELEQEGLARDLVNRLQNLRKDRGLEVTDRVRLQIATDSQPLQQALAAHSDYICREVLAESLDQVAQLPEAQQLEVQQQAFQIHLERA